MATRQHLLLVGKRQPAPQSVCPKLDAELVVQLGDRIAAGHERELGAQSGSSHFQLTYPFTVIDFGH
jgi:hypothetical protein